MPFESRPENIIEKIEASIEPLQVTDIEKLDPILREHIRDSVTGEVIESEIEDTKRFMSGGEEIIDKNSGKTRKRNFLVAKDKNGKVLGCMAYAVPDPETIGSYKALLEMSEEEMEEKCSEVLSAFVSSDSFRGKGVGRQLFRSIVEMAEKQGKEYLLINSGPRYKNSWGFYDKMGAKRLGNIKDKYGAGVDATTWSVNLRESAN